MKFIVAVLVLTFSNLAYSGFEKGTEYANAGNTEKAIKEFQKGSDAGEPMSQWSLGTYYYLGDGLEQNYKKAYELFTTSAAAGVAEANLFLARMYENGYYVKEDSKKAVEHLRLASEKCLPQAMNSYSFYLYEGKIVQQDKITAAALLLAAYWVSHDESMEHFNIVMKELPEGSINTVKQLHHKLIQQYKCKTERPGFD